MKVEILAGDNIQKAFKELGIKATRTYKSTDEPFYDVWEIEKKDLHLLEETMEWPDDWGWWRFSKGSNMGTACDIFEVNGQELIAWSGRRREHLIDDWAGELEDEKAAYHYSFKEYEKDLMPYKYDNLMDYFCNEIGASTEKNVCALAVDLARANGMSMSKLFKTYEG